jgi:hypothetical protein
VLTQSNHFRTSTIMNRFATWIIIVLLSIITKSSYGIADFNKPSKHCHVERVKRMLGYNCVKLELRSIPTYIKSSTEVSFNAKSAQERTHEQAASPLHSKLTSINLNWFGT